MLWIVKLTVTPLLVGLVSLAARRWGPTVGGLLMALPWMTGPILFFLTIERGPEFARDMTVGIETGAIAIGAWTLAFAALARCGQWPLCLLAAILCYGAVGTALGRLDLSLLMAGLTAYVTLALSLRLMPRPEQPDMPRLLPWWDIPVRMMATAILVAIITVSSGALGSRYSGVVATYPVVATVVACFTLARWGAAATIRLLRAMLLSLMGFVTFFLVVGFGIDAFGIVPLFGVAALAALTTSFGLMTLARRGWIKV